MTEKASAVGINSRPAVRRHVVISGTGRCGTTFLVELLTHLGLDTGFAIEELEARKNPTSNAGLEHDIRSDDAPYVVKSPWFCDHAAEVIARSDIVIEHLLLPIRDLAAAAESRRHVTETAVATMPLRKRLRHLLKPSEVPGGLWHTQSAEPSQQEDALLQQIYKLLLALSHASIPITVICYPRLVKDARYLFQRLKPILGDTPFENFEMAFKSAARPALVHVFSADDL